MEEAAWSKMMGTTPHIKKAKACGFRCRCSPGLGVPLLCRSRAS